MKKIKVMHFVSGLVSGGVEEMLYNYCQFMDRNKYEFIIVYQHEPIPVCKEKFDSLGIKCIRVTSRKTSFKKNIKDSIKVIKEEKPDIVHAHMNLMNFCALYAAKKNRINIRISHSHIAEKSKSYVESIIFYICKILCRYFATDYLACGKDAATFLYGNNLVKTGKVEIIPNAIDLLKFSPNDQFRNEIRQRYNIENSFVVGHVGRFTIQKNHIRLIDIFNCLLQEKKESVLLLIGTGELEDEVKNYVSELNIIEKVIFLGTTSKMHEIYNAMDVFILPSLYEGYPVVATEIQAAELPAILSDNIDKTCKLTKYVNFLSLDDSNDRWVNSALEISSLRSTKDNRKLYERFDIRNAQQRLDVLYNSYINRCDGEKDEKNKEK